MPWTRSPCGWAAGRIIGLIGPNGAGKTTFLSLIAGLIFPTEGFIRVCGHPARSLEARRSLGYIPESPAFLSRYSARAVLEYHAALHGLSRRAIAAETDRLLAQLRLEEYADRAVGGFSLGMRQRLALAVALLDHPRLLLLDEPSNGLDPIGVIELRRVLLDVQQSGATIIISSHRLGELEKLTSDYVFLHQGRIVEFGGEVPAGQMGRLHIEFLPGSPARRGGDADAVPAVGAVGGRMGGRRGRCSGCSPGRQLAGPGRHADHERGSGNAGHRTDLCSSVPGKGIVHEGVRTDHGDVPAQGEHSPRAPGLARDLCADLPDPLPAGDLAVGRLSCSRWSGCLLPLVLSAGIFGDDIASGRIRLLVTEPIRPWELYFYRFLGLSLQAAVHLLAAGALILLLHRLTGRGSVDHFAVWMLASWLIFNVWAALSTSVSVVVQPRAQFDVAGPRHRRGGLPAVHAAAVLSRTALGTKVYHGIVRYAGPPVELLVRMGRGKGSLAGSVASVAHSLMLTALYGAAGIVLLGRREFKYVAD